MGTNYYLITKSTKLAHEFFCGGCDEFGVWGEEYELKDTPYFHYEIHLNKLSYGWRPLFQRHIKAFKTFAQLEKFYKDHEDELQIKDEYNEMFSWDEYKETIMGHANRTPVPVRWVYDTDEICGFPGKKYLQTRNCELEEADLFVPFSHNEYEETRKLAKEKYNVKEWDFQSVTYYEDPDYKIDWVDGWFG